jgi:ankyrin repeat protein
MKRLKPYKLFEVKDSLGDLWFTAIIVGDIKRIKDLIKQGVDINMKDKDNWTALIMATTIRYRADKDIIKTLLEDPNIIITTDYNVDDFIESLIFNKKDLSFLKNYDMQKKIINNKRGDIIKYLNKYDLVHPKIKQNYPHIISGVDLNLL